MDSVKEIGKWGWSHEDGEVYNGRFDTKEEAIADARKEADFPFEVAQYRAPHAPEGYIDADDVLEHICCQDEFDHDCAYGFPNASKEELDELTGELQKVVREWMVRHDLLPDWVAIDQSTVERFGAVVPRLEQ